MIGSALVIDKNKLQKRQLALFFILTYAIAWAFFIPLGLSRAGLGWLPFQLSIPVMTVLGSFAPSIAALLTLRFTEKRWPTFGFTSQPARMIVGFIVAPILIAITFSVIPASILTTGPLAKLGWPVLFSGSVFTVFTIIGGPLGEEPGWRGFALPRLQQRLGLARASLVLGILWAAWHLPLFLTTAWSSTRFPTYVLIVTGLSFSMTFLFNLSGNSVITAISAHASFNTTSRWLGGLLANASIRDNPAPELILGLAGWAVALVLVLVLATRGRLALRKRTT